MKKRRSASTPRVVDNPSPEFRPEDMVLAAREDFHRYEHALPCKTTAECAPFYALAALMGVAFGGWVISALSAGGGYGALSAGVTFGPGSLTLAQSLANGLVRQGGRLHPILAEIEAAFTVAAPRSAGAGFELVKQAAARVGYGIGNYASHVWTANGVQIPLADKTATFISSGGAITVTRGAQVVLHLVPPGP